MRLAILVAAAVSGCGDGLSALLATDLSFIPNAAAVGETTKIQVVFSTIDSSTESTIELVGYDFQTSDIELTAHGYNSLARRYEIEIGIVNGAKVQTYGFSLKVRVKSSCCLTASGQFQVVAL